MKIGRSAFLAGTVAGIAAPAAAAAVIGDTVGDSAAPDSASRLRAGRRALVLSGGGALGAYEAGAIGALADRLGLRDGMPLPYDVVCGTSIGAFNAYCVATAQYARLRTAWQSIPQQRIVRLKRRFAKITQPSSGVLTRLAEAVGLVVGLTKDIRGVLDARIVEDLYATLVLPDDPVYVPLYFASTNLSRLRGEIFVRRAAAGTGSDAQRTDDAILALTTATGSLVRDAPDELIRAALFASAAIPVAFDPVTLLSPEGTLDAYADGGITDNVPLGIARRCASALDIILVSPLIRRRTAPYANAVEIGLGVFDTMQRALLELQVRSAYRESAAGAVPQTPTPVTIRVLRPQTELPGSLLSFNDAGAVAAMWQRGYADGSAGFAAYVESPTFGG